MIYLPLDSLSELPLSALLCYPGNDPQCALARRGELGKLGVAGLYAFGQSNVGGQAVLGLGYCGLVMLGQWQEQQVAIKIQRSDSTQANLRMEADCQRCANRVGVGPLLYAASENLLIMEYLPGTGLGNWLTTRDSPQDSEQVRQVLSALLQNAFALDQAGLDHGALRCVAEHVIIDQDRGTLIDFSHASRARRPANVTTLIQGLFWGTRLAEDTGRCLPLADREKLIPLLQQYKQQGSIANFNRLLRALPLCKQ